MLRNLCTATEMMVFDTNAWTVGLQDPQFLLFDPSLAGWQNVTSASTSNSLESPNPQEISPSGTSPAGANPPLRS